MELLRMGFEPATNNSDIWSPRAVTQTPVGGRPCNLQPVRPAVLQEVLQDYHDHDTGYICLGCLCKTICHSGWQCLGCLWAVQVFDSKFNLNLTQARATSTLLLAEGRTHFIEIQRVDPYRAMPSSGTYSTAVS